MLEDKKHVFWQAFFLTILIFGLGLVMGIYLEQLRTNNINMDFYQSENSLYDTIAFIEFSKSSNLSCIELTQLNFEFADKIYRESSLVYQLTESNKITNSMKLIHKKYDLLRTLLWINMIDLKRKCNFSSVIYLYEYGLEDIQIESEQRVWSKILKDLKEDEGNQIVLIPIARNMDIVSLNYLISKYKIEKFPAVIINEKYVIYNHTTIDNLKKYLKK